jgi:asparagine synthase (glutamine-hydrolysing)
MCGLVGSWRYDAGQVDHCALELMLAPIGHRGPDGRGTWHNRRVALGHLRLSIIDLSNASSQPMLTEDGTGVLTYNGEVYNYRELRHELEREGCKFRTSGDTEVVLQALHQWGVERSLRRFNGMFAFAYLDQRTETLWLARDRVGIKPLLAADIGAELIFASEAKALLAHPRMKKRADRHAIGTWILLMRRGSVQNLFEGIDEVAPGSVWKVSGKGIEKWSYFHVLDVLDVDRLRRASACSPESFIASFRHLFRESVRSHLASDAKLAAACSGGVDSSLITAFAKQDVADLAAYVADVAGKGEGDQAARVGHHVGVPVRRIAVDQARLLALWPHAVWHSDGPPTSASDPALLAVAQQCRSDGIKVLLTGEGSDELFGGYTWLNSTYAEWSRRDSWRKFFGGAGRDRQDYAAAPFSTMPARGDPRLRDRMILALTADDELLPERLLRLLSPIEPAADRIFLAHGLWSVYQHLSWILHRHDRIGMAASIEMRVPFLSNEILDFAFHLPRRAKLHRGVGKWVVKKVAAEVLPPDIVYARKKGFPAPLRFSRGTERLLVGGRLADMMHWSASTTNDIVAMLGSREMLRFHVISLELWARIFFAGETPAALSEKLLAIAEVQRFRLGPHPRSLRLGLGRLEQMSRRTLRRFRESRAES